MREKMLLSSSSTSRRETGPVNHQSKNIGCMSGIFLLVSKYHKRRKFLTSAEKQDENVTSSPEILEKTPSKKNCKLDIFSNDLQRSPTIPSEIRLSSSVKSPQNLHRSPAAIARLMGLNEIPTAPSLESTTEKRQKLLEALKKCDEDLKSLKKIVESVRSANHMRSSPTETTLSDCCSVEVKGQTSLRVVKQWSEDEEIKGRASSEIRRKGFLGDVDGGDLTKKEKRCSEVNSEQPSPVSVLDGISSTTSPSSTGEKYTKLRDCDITNLSFFHKITLETLPKLSGRREDDQGKYLSLSMSTTVTRTSCESPFWSSKGKVESVNEICKDVIWEQRWELGRLGVVLEDYMFGELIEEIIKELWCCYNMYSLPYEACKRRLCF